MGVITVRASVESHRNPLPALPWSRRHHLVSHLKKKKSQCLGQLVGQINFEL